MESYIEFILFDCSYSILFGVSFGYFLLLYFGMGSLFLYVCKFLERKKILTRINSTVVDKKQISFEIRHSLKSILVFGFSIIPIIYLIRAGLIDLLPNTVITIVIGVGILTIWNEVHFYVIHRIMHHRFMMRHIHFIHHKSRIPTVFSVYSFHWIEALLLSTVPLTIVPFIPFSILAVFSYPIVSILLNFAGHCNYRFGSGTGDKWKLLGTHHNDHHKKGRENYGFALHVLDKIFSSKTENQ